jgi:hypothetical protein
MRRSARTPAVPLRLRERSYCRHHDRRPLLVQLGRDARAGGGARSAWRATVLRACWPTSDLGTSKRFGTCRSPGGCPQSKRVVKIPQRRPTIARPHAGPARRQLPTAKHHHPLVGRTPTQLQLPARLNPETSQPGSNERTGNRGSAAASKAVNASSPDKDHPGDLRPHA